MDPGRSIRYFLFSHKNTICRYFPETTEDAPHNGALPDTNTKRGAVAIIRGAATTSYETSFRNAGSLINKLCVRAASVTGSSSKTSKGRERRKTDCCRDVKIKIKNSSQIKK